MIQLHQSGRHFLQIPGPTNVPDRILRALERPTIDHRGPEFKGLGLRGARRYQGNFPDETAGDHLPRFWERRVGSRTCQHTLPRRSGADVRHRALRQHMAQAGKEAEPSCTTTTMEAGGRALSPEEIEQALAEDKDHTIKSVCVVHNDTATGITSDIPAIRKAIDHAGHSALFFVDTISSLGSIDYRHDEWCVDVTVGGSQKGLMLPPGLSFNAISKKALFASGRNEATKFLLGLAGHA